MELRAEDLRLGNLVHEVYSSENLPVLGIIKNDIYLGDGYSNIKYLKPIPLTEEWLLKFGFVFIDGFYRKDEISIEYDDIKLPVDETSIWFKSIYIKDIFYVNDLQNLYYALTNKELQVL